MPELNVLRDLLVLFGLGVAVVVAAAVVGATGMDALTSLAQIMLGFYLTCAVFVFVVLGVLLRLVARINIFSLFRSKHALQEFDIITEPKLRLRLPWYLQR